ncbi:MAG: sigma-54 dependent transcriptional regulator [Polyangiaceae bacterium]
MPHSKSRIAILVRDPVLRGELLTALGGSQGAYDVSHADDAQRGVQLLETARPDLILADTAILADASANLVRRARETGREVMVLAVVPAEARASGRDAVRRGAFDFVAAPFDVESTRFVVERALATRGERLEMETVRQRLRERDAEGLDGLIGASPAMQKVFRAVRQVAPSRSVVLLVGESGTGKCALARTIHRMSDRAKGPFVTLHTHVGDGDLVRERLFGTPPSGPSRTSEHPGAYARATGGTLFVEEVAELPLDVQARLVALLEPPSTSSGRPDDALAGVDVRLVAGTTLDLAAEVKAGRFRDDLHQRLSVVPVEVPPLRLRGNDVLLLAGHFLRRIARDSHRRIDAFSEKARGKILAHRWPGNVRALEVAVERAVALAEGTIIDEQHLPMDDSSAVVTSIRIPGSNMAEIERYAIVKTLESVGGSTTRAAELLEISVRTIQYRLHEYGMSKNPKSSPPSEGA